MLKTASVIIFFIYMLQSLIGFTWFALYLLFICCYYHEDLQTPFYIYFIFGCVNSTGFTNGLNVTSDLLRPDFLGPQIQPKNA